MNGFDVLLAVRPRVADALRAELRSLPGGEGSPFAGAVHFARLTLLPDRPRAGDACLLAGVVVDGGLDAVVAALRPLGRVWRYCEGWPGEGAGFAEWVRAHALEPDYAERCYDAPVGEVVAAVALRRRISAFACDHQASDPATLHRAFREAFA